MFQHSFQLPFSLHAETIEQKKQDLIDKILNNHTNNNNSNNSPPTSATQQASQNATLLNMLKGPTANGSASSSLSTPEQQPSTAASNNASLLNLLKSSNGFGGSGNSGLSTPDPSGSSSPFASLFGQNSMMNNSSINGGLNVLLDQK